MNKQLIKTELLDWRPYERTEEDGSVSLGAVCYLDDNDGILPLNDISHQAGLLGLNFGEATLTVLGGYAIVDCPNETTIP